MSLFDAWAYFSWQIVAALVAALVAPVVGAHLLVRRQGFHGVVLPQFASAGVAASYFAMPLWGAAAGDHGHVDDTVVLLWAVGAVTLALAVFAATSARPQTETARVAAGFAVAGAATMLLQHLAPLGSEKLEGMIHGQMLLGTASDVALLSAVYLVVGICLLVLHRDLLLAVADPTLVRARGGRLGAWNTVHLALVAATVSVGTLVVGPVVLFGLLVIPPLAARSLARSGRGLFRASIALGLIATILGLELCFRLDLPFGPCLVGAAALELPVAWLVGRIGARVR